MAANVTFDVLKEMMAQQERSFLAAIKMIISDIKDDLKAVKNDVAEFKHSLEFTQHEVNQVQNKLVDIAGRLDGFKIQIEDEATRLEDLEDKVEYIENQSRRNNVKIVGVPENLDTEKTWDDMEKVVRKVIKDNLMMENAAELSIESAHRLGRKQRRHYESGSKVKLRPIVVKFSHWKQKERVLRIAREKKPNGIMFYPDMAKRTLDRRNEQIPDLIEERKKGKIAYFVMDQLVVRDKEEPRDLESNGTGISSDGEVFVYPRVRR